MICKLFRFSTVMLFCCTLFFSFSSRAEEDSAITDEQLSISLNLLKSKMSNATGNFVLSPVSVYIASDLLANGAGGETLNKLQKLILSPHHNLSLKQINQALSKYMQDLSPAIKINNSVWGNNFKPEYKQSVAALAAEAHALPQNTGTINDWISDKTQGKIKDILPLEKTEYGYFYLVSTVYFNDRWRNVFDKDVTEVKPFYSLDAAQPTPVYMMYKFGGAQYYENNKFQAIRMWYQEHSLPQKANSDTSDSELLLDYGGMYAPNHIDIILPKQGIDFRKFVRSLKLQDIKIPYREYDDSNIDLDIYLPRFEVNYKTSLTAWFKAGGIPLFREDKELNLSALSDIPQYVKAIIHQANIRVDEKGTEATAATVVMGGTYGGGMIFRERQRKEFNANRPFIFVLNDGLFIGAYIKGFKLEAK